MTTRHKILAKKHSDFAFLISSLLIPFFTLIQTLTIAQDADSVTLSKKELKNLITLINEDVGDDDQEVVGKFFLFKTKVRVFKSPNGRTTPDSTKTVNIKKVKLHIKDGVVFDIQVVTDDNLTFTNYYSPININLFNETSGNVTCLNKGKIEWIFLNNFLRWERERGYNPREELAILSDVGDSVELKRGVGINYVVDLNLFTDLPGLFGDKPNGITQTEAYTKFVTNTSHVRFKKNKTYPQLGRKSPILFKYFSVRAIFSKFDSKYETTVLDEDFSRQELLQKANVNVDFTLNLLSSWLPRKSPNWFSINTGGGIYSSSLSTETDTSNVILPYFFFEPYIELRSSQNFGLDFSLRFFRQQARQVEGFEEWRWIFRPQATLFWNPVDAPSSKIFARISYYSDLDDKENPFFQFQVGYSLRLSNVINPAK